MGYQKVIEKNEEELLKTLIADHLVLTICVFLNNILGQGQDNFSYLFYFVNFFQEVENASPERDINGGVGKKPERVPKRKFK